MKFRYNVPTVLSGYINYDNVITILASEYIDATPGMTVNVSATIN